MKSGELVAVLEVILLLLIALGLLCMAGRAQEHPMQPNSKLTPGALDSHITQDNIQQTICLSGYTKTVRNVPISVKKEVVREYGLPESDLSKVEIDHYISLEIGGSNSIENLWPQFYSAAPGQKGYLGARQKDVVETELKRQVCSGQMRLEDAQVAIRAWPTYYKRYEEGK